MSDDHRLITDCLRGDTTAFGVLVRRHQDRLYSTVCRLLGNAEDARDVVQETFLSAYQSLGSFKGDSQFFTWLYRIAVNAAISFQRKQRVLVRLDWAGGGADGREPPDRSESAQPGRALEQADEQRRIRHALDRLSAEHRTVLVLKDMEGLKYEDMAQLLDVPIGTIRSRLHRARLELRELLEKTEE